MLIYKNTDIFQPLNIPFIYVSCLLVQHFNLLHSCRTCQHSKLIALKPIHGEIDCLVGGGNKNKTDKSITYSVRLGSYAGGEEE